MIKHSTPTGSRDPLAVLGVDVFHMVLQNLDARSLVAVDDTCKAWRAFTSAQGRLWRRVCEQERVDMDEYRAWRNQSGREAERDEYRSAARSHVPLRGAWAEGHCYDWVVPQKVHVRRMMLGPDADDLTIIEDSSGGIWDLYVLDKYTGQRTFAIEALPDEVNVVAGGGYLVTSSNGNSTDAGIQIFQPLGELTLWRKPKTQPHIDYNVEYNAANGPPALEKWGDISWMANCDSMRLHVDNARGKSPSPVLVAAKNTEVHFCFLNEDLRRTKIDITIPDIHDRGRVARFSVDDEYIFMRGIQQVHIICRATGALVLSMGPTSGVETRPFAALAYKMSTQTLVDYQSVRANLTLRNADGTSNTNTVQFRRVTDLGRQESIWQVDVEGFNDDDPMGDEQDTNSLQPDNGTTERDPASTSASPQPPVKLSSLDGDKADGQPKDRGLTPVTWFDFEDLSGASYQDPNIRHFCFVDNSLVMAGGDAGIIVIQNYKDMLKSIHCKSLSMDERRRIAAAYTLVVGIPWDSVLNEASSIVQVASSGSMLILDECNTGVFYFDLSQFPTLPIRNLDDVPSTNPIARVMAPTWAPINYPPNTTLLADARAVYCVDPDQTDPRQHRHVTASRIPLWNNWRKAMGKYPGSVQVWSFRPVKPGEAI